MCVTVLYMFCFVEGGGVEKSKSLPEQGWDTCFVTDLVPRQVDVRS